MQRKKISNSSAQGVSNEELLSGGTSTPGSFDIGYGTASTADNGILYQKDGLTHYRRHAIYNNGGAQLIDVDVNLDGSNWNFNAPVTDESGTPLASQQIADTWFGFLEGPIYEIRVRNKGGTTSANCIVFHYK